jgi:hypothetical protein
MSKASKWGSIGLTGLTVALLLAAQPARADTEILDSTVPALKIGAVLKDDTRITIPDGATVRVMVTSESGVITKTLKGPYEGRVADYKEERSWWERLTGKTKDPEPSMGTTRGLKAPQ